MSFGAATLAALALVSASPAKLIAGTYTLVQNATLVHPGYHSHAAAEVNTSGSLTSLVWGAVNLIIPSGLTVGQLNNLSTDYRFALGSCWEGSPRFEAWVTTPTGTAKLFFYIGPPATGWTGCPTGVWASTGNLASPSTPVDATELGGSYEAYSAVQAAYGSCPVSAIYLDADGGWYQPQTVDFDNAQVNTALYSFQ